MIFQSKKLAIPDRHNIVGDVGTQEAHIKYGDRGRGDRNVVPINKCAAIGKLIMGHQGFLNGGLGDPLILQICQFLPSVVCTATSN